MLTDNRCPLCNEPVVGRNDVILTRPKKEVSECQHCGTRVFLKQVPKDSTIQSLYYDNVK